MLKSLLLRYLLLLLSLIPLLAFHERLGKSGFGRSASIRKADYYVMLQSLGKGRLSTPSKNKNDATTLYASRQFRNVEEMLDSFHEELILINFMAINCGPCRLQKKELASVSHAIGNDLHLLAIDTNRWPSVSSRFEVRKLPCLVAIKNGKEVFRIEGLTKAENVVRSLQEHQAVR